MEAKKSFFEQPAKNIIQGEFKLVSITSDTTIAPALQTLLKSGIYGAPVSNPGEDPKSQWIGFIELSDLVAFIISLFEGGQDKISAAVIAANRTYTDEQLDKINSVLNTTTLKEFIAKRPTHASSWSLDDTATIQNVIDALSSRSRVVLISRSSGNIIGLISRSALIAYFAKNMTALAEAAPQIIHQNIEEAHLVKKEKMVTSNYQDEERALDAFAKIAETHISHLALVNEASGNFDLVGNVSLKDIKSVFDNKPGGGPVGVKILLMPVGPYINHIRQENLKAVHPAIHATIEGPGAHGAHHGEEGGDTVEKVINRLAATKIHRMYVTTASQQGSARNLVGVLSLGDLVRLFKAHTQAKKK